MTQTRRPSDPPPRTAKDRWKDLRTKTDLEPIKWSSCDPRALQAAIVSATEDGAALLFSKTSDGGALALQVLSGTARYKYYAADTEDLDDLLRAMTTDENG